jgi:Uma2 family endonuclease
MEVQKLGEVFSSSALEAAEAFSAVPASRKAFLQVIETWPENIKIEYINNCVILQGPPTHFEAQIMDRLQYILHLQAMKEGGSIGTYKVLVDLGNNLVMPDLPLFTKNTHDAVADDQWLFPTPEVVIEVTSKDTWDYDHEKKLEVYEEGGVLEYWLIEPDESVLTIYSRNEASSAKFQNVKALSNASDYHQAAGFDQLKVTHEQVFDPDYNLLDFSRAVLNSLC